jgi:plasmid rolling circle replication initiator protein Rep
MMHGQTNIKIENAKQAKEILDFKNLKRRLHKTTAAIWFSKNIICCVQQSCSPDDGHNDARNMLRVN